ncbi:NAD(P)H-dependent oxidoreductase [Deinococcus apachensis]|uniref:NAD(P)H-dependent oxidoreductase n=1 Tax=Deinococcus apachensis TaxID=309886 RepID=UPI00035DCC1A|nr:NAD(P)H-dependent oxidoreductase [Deinococcus apachensis]
MHILIVHVHPEPQSFNAALTHTAVHTLEALGHTVEVSDLYALGFNPVAGRNDVTQAADPAFLHLQREQKAAFERGTTAPDIVAEQRKLTRAELVIFQFPVWWRSAPALLKGWFDRVLTVGYAYGAGRVYATGGLSGRRALLSVTFGSPTSPEEAREVLHQMQDGVLAFVGFEVLPPFVVGGPRSLTVEERQAELERYRDTLAHLALGAPLERSLALS